MNNKVARMRQSVDPGYPRYRANFSSLNPYDLGYNAPEEEVRRDMLE